MKRYLSEAIRSDLPAKIVLVMGPRQCGKTTLSKQLASAYDYLNYDLAEDRALLAKKAWDRNKDLIILDELHKMKGWKRWLKGIYDSEGIPPQLLVTGSAQLNTFRHVGDSLAGRHFPYCLHPLDLKEVITYCGGDEAQAFEQLLACSGFPEPFLNGSAAYYKRWRRSHLEIILHQDLMDLYSVQDLKAIEDLVVLLRHRVGATVSYANLARDLQKDINTIKRWLLILENLYIIYRVTPYSKQIARSLLKEPKFYFYDHNWSGDDVGAKLENIVANALRKALDYLRDTLGVDVGLYYLRTKDGKEIDFLVSIDEKPVMMLEVKTSHHEPSASFGHFQKFMSDVSCVQLVRHLNRESTYPNGVQVRDMVKWLAKISFADKCPA